MYAQAQNPELYEQAPMPGMERPAPNPNFGQTAVANVTHLMPEGAYAQRNPEPTATISINQPQDEVSPGLRRAVDSAVDKAFNKNTTNSDTNPTATASDQTQECVDAALAEPEFNRNGRTSVMTAPGSKTEQLVSAGADFEAMPDDCSSLVSRATPEVFLKMQRPNNHKRFITTKPQEILRDDLGYNINPPIGDSGGHGSSWVMTTPLHPPRKGWTFDRNFLYRCTPGKGITKFFAVFELGANSAVDDHSLGQKSYTVPGRVVFNPEYVITGGLEREC